MVNMRAGVAAVTVKVKSETRLDSLDLNEIGQNMVIRAWGQVNNGYLTADLIVYDPID